MAGRSPMKQERIDQREYDVVIIGGGPAGLTAGIRCRSHDMSVLLLEARKLGGQLTQLYPTKFVLDYASYPEIRAGYLADLFVRHARDKGVQMRESASVQSIRPAGQGFHVSVDGQDYHARVVILAIGMGVFEPTTLGIKGEKEFAGSGVAYAVPNLSVYRGRKLLVVGGGDTAVENAIGLSQVARVTLVHRSNHFRAIEANLSLLSESLVEVCPNTELVEIRGRDHVERVILRNNQTGDETEAAVDGVIINIGFSPDLSLVHQVDVKTDSKHIIMETFDMRTNVEGILACGDIVAYPGKSRQIQPATAEGFIAAETAYQLSKRT